MTGTRSHAPRSLQSKQWTCLRGVKILGALTNEPEAPARANAHPAKFVSKRLGTFALADASG